MEKEILNRVSQSNLIQVDIESYYPQGERVLIDLKDFLVNEELVIEKEFRKAVEAFNWDNYKNKYVGIVCSVNTIIPQWAYMLVSLSLLGKAKKVVYGGIDEINKTLYLELFQNLDYNQFNNKPIIIKGCGKLNLPNEIYIYFTNRVAKHAKSVMFGEACSAVPLFKKKIK